MEQLKRELAASEEEYRKQTQIQVRSMRRASENNVQYFLDFSTFVASTLKKEDGSV